MATLNEKPRWSTVLMKMLWMISCSSRVGGTCQKFPIFILIADNIIRPLFPVGGETSSKYLDFASSPTLYGDGGHNSEMCGQNKVNLESFVTLKSESAFMEILLEHGDLYADVSVKIPPARMSLGKGLATLIASVKLQRSCQVGVLPDTRKCYNSDQIICVNGY